MEQGLYIWQGDFWGNKNMGLLADFMKICPKSNVISFWNIVNLIMCDLVELFLSSEDVLASVYSLIAPYPCDPV